MTELSTYSTCPLTNQVALCGHAHGIVTKTVHKTLPWGGRVQGGGGGGYLGCGGSLGVVGVWGGAGHGVVGSWGSRGGGGVQELWALGVVRPKGWWESWSGGGYGMVGFQGWWSFRVSGI